MENIKSEIKKLLDNSSIDKKVEIINELREFIHNESPFKNEPVDFVRWVKSDKVVANDYNPNKVAPPEMELLEVSIFNDGYTQPIVTWPTDDHVEVVDGFHRNRVGKESKVIHERIMGYLPIVAIRGEQSSKSDRIASTIRHNRARGKHQVDAMSEIVIELKNRNWSNARISKQLGMDEEEVLRLCQISGLENLFSDNDFSNAWESSDYIEEYEELTDDVDDVIDNYRIPNEKDESRIFHTYDKWECHKAGFYKSTVEGMTKKQAEEAFADFFRQEGLFAEVIENVIKEWKHSCEHYLTNRSMNRIAWLGQASVCYHTGIPSVFAGGWFLLTEKEQEKANKTALIYLNKWLKENNREELELEEALSIGRQTELY